MLEERARQNLMMIVAAYRKATGVSLGAVSRRFYGNAEFLGQYQRGNGSITLRAMDKMLGKLRAEWPEKAVWPLTRAIMMGRTERE